MFLEQWLTYYESCVNGGCHLNNITNNWINWICGMEKNSRRVQL